MVDRFELSQGCDEAAEVTENGPWVRYEDYEKLEAKSGRQGANVRSLSKRARRAEVEQLDAALDQGGDAVEPRGTRDPGEDRPVMTERGAGESGSPLATADEVRGILKGHESLQEAARAALASFEETGDYEAPVQALRDLLPPQPEPGSGEESPSKPGDYGRHLREVVDHYRSLPPKERRSSGEFSVPDRQVPEEAVEAAVRSWSVESDSDDLETAMREALQAAAPLILGQDRRRFPDGTYCICPEHDLLMPYRFVHWEWSADEGCPVLMDGENACGEPVQVVDPVALIRSQERQRVREALEPIIDYDDWTRVELALDRLEES